MPHHIDLYSIYGLDRRQPPEALVAQLTGHLNSTDPRDALTRSRIDTARAILGDPARRVAYDAALADPNAPVLDEQALAAIAGRPVPATARSGLAGAFASRQIRILSAATAALALILVIGITAVACSGGSDPRPTAAPNGSGQSTSVASGNSACEPSNNASLSKARWRESLSAAPSRVIVLEKKIDLPNRYPFGDSLGDVSYFALGQGFKVSYRGLAQFQDRSIGVFQGPDTDNLQTLSASVTTVGQDGTIISTRDYTLATAAQMPTGFDLARTPAVGYFHITTANGVQVPAQANGTKDGQVYAAQLVADAFDQTVVWVILRGEGSAIYKAKFFEATDASACPN